MTNHPPKAALTADMREFLGAADGRRLLYDIILDFQRRFSVDAHTAGRLLAEWVRETC